MTARARAGEAGAARGAGHNRRGRRVAVTALLIALLFFGGQGLSFRADRGRGEERGAPFATPPSPSSPADTPEPETAAPAPAPASEPHQDADRFHGRLAAVRADLRRGDIASACAELALVASDPLAAGAPELVGALEREVDAALRAALDDLRGRIERGAAPHAAHLVARLGDPPHERPEDALVTLARERGWPRLSGTAVPADLDLRAPPDLPAGRRVEFLLDGDWHAGTVAGPGDAEDTVTVRVERAGAVLFPAIPRRALAPVDPSAEELAHQLVAALRAGDGGLARAWLACRIERGAGLPADLAEPLAPWFDYR